MCWNTDPKPTTPRHILVKPMDFKEREKSLGHIEKKKSILLIKERKLDYHQTLCQKKME